MTVEQCAAKMEVEDNTLPVDATLEGVQHELPETLAQVGHVEIRRGRRILVYLDADPLNDALLLGTGSLAKQRFKLVENALDGLVAVAPGFFVGGLSCLPLPPSDAAR